MKRLSILLLVFLFSFGLMVMASTNAEAWRIDMFHYSYPTHGDDYDWGDLQEEITTEVWYQITNDSTESITAFGVGVSLSGDIQGGGYGLGMLVLAPIRMRDDIGYWESTHYLSTPEDWLGYREYFGGSDWESLFGDYTLAYISYGYPAFFWNDTYFPDGQIPGGMTLGSGAGEGWNVGYAFGFLFRSGGRYADAVFNPGSPAIVLFEDSGISIGSTNTNNPNPNAVPEPATMLLMGMGLTGLALIRRRYGKA